MAGLTGHLKCGSLNDKWRVLRETVVGIGGSEVNELTQVFPRFYFLPEPRTSTIRETSHTRLKT